MAAASGAAAEVPARLDRAPEEDLPALEPAEVRNRLENSERQFRNRRKVLIRGLPADVSNQDVHELLKDFELKYCFVDKYKGTAFITLLNSSQACSAISLLHGSQLRGSTLRVQLQAADSVLCVANLPRLLSQQQFEELVRPFGNLERCFLVYSPSTGHSKGYGFVEYMKKDSAARARSELQGKVLGTRTLFVHWSEATLSPDLLHSRCLCIDKLPHGFSDLQQLQGLFGSTQAPSFCQLAQGPDGRPAGFAVAEFGSPEAAERAQAAADGTALGGSRLRVSFCAPGPGGAATLAALMAARATALHRGRGLLPEPPLLQLLSSPNLQLLLQPLLGRQAGILGAAPSLPLVPNPGIPSALLQLTLNSHTQKPGILGDSPLSSLIPPKAPGKLLGEIPADLAPKSALGTPQGPPKIGTIPKKNQGEGGAPPLSLLGEPPKKLQLPLNLNLNLNLPRGHRKGFRVKPGVLGIPPSDPLEFPQDLGSRIFPQPNLGSFRHQAPPLFSGSPSSCFSSGLRAGLRQSQLSKTFSIPSSSDSILPLAPPNPHLKTFSIPSSSDSILPLAPPNPHLKTPLGGHKRGFSHLLPSPEPSPEGCYVGQHSQGLGGHYADSYLKRKRIF